MTKKNCEISASSWFYYKEICYDARSYEHKIQMQILLEFLKLFKTVLPKQLDVLMKLPK